MKYIVFDFKNNESNIKDELLTIITTNNIIYKIDVKEQFIFEAANGINVFNLIYGDAQTLIRLQDDDSNSKVCYVKCEVLKGFLGNKITHELSNGKSLPDNLKEQLQKQDKIISDYSKKLRFISDKDSKLSSEINKPIFDLLKAVNKGYINVEYDIIDLPIIQINTNKKCFKINLLKRYANSVYNENNDVYNFNDLISYEVESDYNTVFSSTTSGGNGKALIGGLLFGAPGAIVGASNSKKKTYTSSTDYCEYLKIKIVVKGKTNSNIIIDIIKGSVDKSSKSYKKALEITENLISMLDYIKANTTENNSIDPVAAADALLKYKELLDMKVITKKEFEEKKKELLSGSVSESISDDLFMEEKEKFYCTNCNAEVEEDDTECPNCGLSFVDEDEVEEDEEILEEDSEEIEEDSEEELYECDNCKAIVKESDEKCPNCGLIFK